MRRLPLFLIATSIALAPTLEAQGAPVRARLGAPNNRWTAAEMELGPGDSLDLRMPRGAMVVRVARGDVSIERRTGFDRRTGAIRGAMIGGLVGVATPFLIPDMRESGWGAVFSLIFGAIGVGGGALVGTAVAPAQWEPYSLASGECAVYRLAPGTVTKLRTADGATREGTVVRHEAASIAIQSAGQASPTRVETAGASVELTGAKNRKKGALIWGAAGLGLGAVGAATDPEIGSGEAAGAIIGNALFFGAIGAWVGTSGNTRLPLPCR
jgi:hypothetical protein